MSTTMSPNEHAIIVYVRSAYGFLIGHDYSHTNKDLAEAIKDYCDLDNPRNKVVYDVLMKFPDLKGDKP